GAGEARARGSRRPDARRGGDRPGGGIPLPARHRSPRHRAGGHADSRSLDPATGRRRPARGPLRPGGHERALRSRVLAWDGCINVRDLGGLPLEGGGETRFGVAVRADSIRTLTDGGWRELADYGVRLAVDLRSDEE